MPRMCSLLFFLCFADSVCNVANQCMHPITFFSFLLLYDAILLVFFAMSNMLLVSAFPLADWLTDCACMSICVCACAWSTICALCFGDFVVVICLNFIVRLLPVVYHFAFGCCRCFFLSFFFYFFWIRFVKPSIDYIRTVCFPSRKCVFVSERIAVNFSSGTTKWRILEIDAKKRIKTNSKSSINIQI